MKKNTALITGAGRGIGLAITKRLSPKYKLILITKTAVSAKQLEKNFPRSLVYVSDLTHSDKVIKLAQQIKKSVSHIDVIINNAGIYHSGTLENTPLNELDEMYILHMKTPLLLIQEFLSLLKRSHQKQIINISSAANFARLPTEGGYTATKAGLTALSDILQLELQKYSIRVTAIHPWSVNTKNFKDGDNFLQSDDIADIVEFILSRNNKFQILNVEASGVKDWRGAWPPWNK